ncbi:glycosyltransferase family 4 protein [Paraburkholderia kururiensis]|uniref:Glycosyltransferase family 4 protein n=1 Tax=Paraburkholderia kururiensis TaxID=984307 RepID=A0ABZ0WSE6_9BURK|nr:glycosyltransferase family 4 protein [Paraburkholderia kururiensis]WQD80312.1 glycosyltransferase family 4 protein [Paraburkholderia kururiensis]
MKIVHLANHAQNVGNGIVNMMVDLACVQARAGHEVTVATSGGGFEPLFARYGVRHVELRQSKTPWRVPAMLAGMRRLVAQTQPDVVHAHMMTGALMARLCTTRRRFALVTTVHNEFQKSATVMGVGDCVVAVSDAVAASMAARGIPAAKLAVVRNGTIGTPRFAADVATADSADAGATADSGTAAQSAAPVLPAGPLPGVVRPSIVTVAGMYERKGIADLLRAFAMLCGQTHRPVQPALYLVGDGPDRARMEALAATLGVADRAHFTGFMANPRAWLAQADVFVLASHREPGGLVLSEAREAGCAIVATNVDGNPEMLDRGEAGRLVPASDPEALAAAIGGLIDDAAARQALAARAREHLDVFSVTRVCADYLALYERTLEARRAGRARGAGTRAAASDAAARGTASARGVVR